MKKGNALLGIVSEEGIPRWLCVAVEGEKPAQMGDKAVFVPTTPYSESEGFWVIFQDADTGEYVTVGEK